MRQKFNSIVALALVVMTITSMFAPAMAIETTGQTPVTINSEAAIFDVTIPTCLPVNADNQGTVTTSNNVKIINNSWGPIYIAGLEVSAQNNWAIDGYDTSAMYAEKVDTKKIAMVINNCKTTPVGSIEYAMENFPRMEGKDGKNWIPINYNAKLPAHRSSLDKTVPMNVLFTVAWLTVDSPSVIPENPYNKNGESVGDYNLKLSVPDSLIIGEESTATATQDSGAITWTNSNPNVIKLTTTSTGLSTVHKSIFDYFLLTASAEDPITSTASIKAVGLGTSTITVQNASGEAIAQDITVIKNELSGLTVITGPSKTVYNAGESFDTSGMVVEADYLNGEKYIISAYNYDASPLAQGQTSERVWYSEQGIAKETSVPITVNASLSVLTKIEVSQAPDKTTYVEATSFDKTGMVVNAIYSDGSIVAITDYSTNKGLLVLGDNQVVISYKGKQATVPVAVIEVALSSIAVTQSPIKTDYVEGQAFDKTGMVVNATYNNGTITNVTGYTVDKTTLSTSDTQVTVSYGGKTATTPITVAIKTLSSIDVTTAPTKIDYVEGQSFDVTGMVITGAYNDGTTAAITGYTVDKTTLIAGDSQVVVSFGGKQAIVPITVAVKSLAKINVTIAPTKTTYIEGQNFDVTGMVVTATYNNGSTAAVSEYSVSNGTAMTAGQDTVTIAYGGESCTTIITVAAKTLTSIAVTTAPTKIAYSTGEFFAPAGMIITAYYDNSSFATISGYSYPMTAFVGGETSVTVTYGGKSCTTPVTVTATTAPVPANVTDYYTFTNDTATTGGYKVGLNAAFKTALQANSGVGAAYKDWVPGTALPNPGSMYSGTPVTSIASIFSSCSTIKTLNLNNWDTGNIVSTQLAFASCTALTSLNINNWNTSKVTTLFNTFYNCSALTVLDVSSWNTSAVTNMSSMFYKCSKLTFLNLSAWSTKNTTTMESMFSTCTALTSINAENFNTANVKNMSNMFNGCAALTTLDLNSWDTSNVTTTQGMFNGCIKLSSLLISNWNTGNVVAMLSMFYNCKALTSLDISSWNTGNVTNMNSMFSSCSSLASINLDNWNTIKTTDTGSMFNSCTKLTSLNLNSWNTSSIVSTSAMFQSCSGLTSLDLSNWSTANVTNISNMFYGCSNLTSINVSTWSTPKVTNAASTFYSCGKLTIIDLSSWYSGKMTSKDSMFLGCYKATVGYAGSNDIVNFNNSTTGKPATLTFVVKP